MKREMSFDIRSCRDAKTRGAGWSRVERVRVNDRRQRYLAAGEEAVEHQNREKLHEPAESAGCRVFLVESDDDGVVVHLGPFPVPAVRRAPAERRERGRLVCFDGERAGSEARAALFVGKRGDDALQRGGRAAACDAIAERVFQ